MGSLGLTRQTMSVTFVPRMDSIESESFVVGSVGLSIRTLGLVEDSMESSIAHAMFSLQSIRPSSESLGRTIWRDICVMRIVNLSPVIDALSIRT
jgi:hypothetical protein